MAQFDYAATAAALTDVQFELLVRARLQMEAARYGGSASVSISLAAVVRNDRTEKCKWGVYFDYGETTSGERLHPTVTEAMRRRGWEESPEATMLLIEGN